MRALFEVGEEVWIVSLIGGSLRKREIEHIEHVVGCRILARSRAVQDDNYTGFMYWMTEETGFVFREMRLRKIDKPAEHSFDQLITELNRETVCE